MAYGAKLYGKTGALLIDDTYEGYAFLGNYSLTWTGAGGDPNQNPGPCWPVYHNYTCDIVSPGRPLLFYKPPHTNIGSGAMPSGFINNQIAGLALVALMNIGGNTWRAYFVRPSIGGGSSTIKAFVSTKYLGTSSNTYGMRVRNSSGDLVFDSGWNPLNPVPKNQYMDAMQANTSNVVGTTILFNDAWRDVINTNYPNDVWLSAYTSAPTILTYLGGGSLYYTYIFRVFSTITRNGQSYIVCWPAIVNNYVAPTYNVCMGTATGISTTILTYEQMEALYP